MTSRAAAGRYARALFDVALAEADPQAVQRELEGFAGLVSGNEALQRALTNPAVPAAKKRAVVEQILDRLESISTPLARLLLLLADRDRLGLIPELEAAFRNRLMEHLRIVRAEVTSAVALPPEKLRALQDGIAAATGRDVQMETRVDPSLIGGVVTRIGSTIFDGSVTRQLERLRESLRAAE